MATILVVDDNALNRNLLTTLLGYRGHRTVEAASGREAIDQTVAGHPELIISDRRSRIENKTPTLIVEGYLDMFKAVLIRLEAPPWR